VGESGDIWTPCPTQYAVRETREKDENSIWRSLIQLDLAQKPHTWYMQIGTEMCSLEVGYSARTKKCSHGFAKCPKAVGSRMRLVRLLHNLSNSKFCLDPRIPLPLSMKVSSFNMMYS
jgi:hypothetical protein